jgi:hypothetical protein
MTTKKAVPPEGLQLVDALKKKFGLSSDRALASHLGITTAGLQLWKKRTTITSRQLASLVGAAYLAGEAGIQATAIRPLVEFFKLEKCASRQGAKYELFAADKSHPYLTGLKDELTSHHGVYVFFDSRGHAIYAGKARRQNLWREMTLAFNRNRGEVQGVKRVHHPSRRQPYKTNDEKTRQIVYRVLPLHEMATYVSAYSVVDGMVDEVEAMLVRSFANDLLNVRMEHFGRRASR